MSDFVARVLVKAAQLSIDDASVFMVVSNGLIPSIRNAVLQKGSKTLDELLQTATIFEAANDLDPTGNGEILKALTAMQLQLKRLNDHSASPVRSELGNRTASFNLPSDSYPQPHDDEKYPTLPSSHDFPLNETYNDQSLRSALPNRSRSLERTFRTPPPPLMSLNPRPTSRTFAPHFNRPGSSSTTYPNHSPVSPQQRNCGKCGCFHPPNSCPAYGLQSRLCFRFNHVAKCCRFRLRNPP